MDRDVDDAVGRRPPILDYRGTGSDGGLLPREWLSLWLLYLLACGAGFICLVIFVESAADENAFHSRMSFGFLTYLVLITLTAIALALGGGRRLILWWRAFTARRPRE